MFLYVSVCILSVPPNSYIVQQTGIQSTFGTPIMVECIPGYRISGSESNANVTTSIQCNADGMFDSTPTCEPKGKETWYGYTENRMFSSVLHITMYFKNVIHWRQRAATKRELIHILVGLQTLASCLIDNAMCLFQCVPSLCRQTVILSSRPDFRPHLVYP